MADSLLNTRVCDPSLSDWRLMHRLQTALYPYRDYPEVRRHLLEIEDSIKAAHKRGEAEAA